VDESQHNQKRAHDNQKPKQVFREGDRVYAKDFTPSSQKWREGIVAEVNGPLSYKIKLTDGSVVHRHVDSVKARTTEASTAELSPQTSFDDSNLDGIVCGATQEDEDVSSSELVSSL